MPLTMTITFTYQLLITCLFLLRMTDGMTSCHPRRLPENMISIGEQPIGLPDNGRLDMLLTWVTLYNHLCSLELVHDIFTGVFVSFVPDTVPGSMKIFTEAEIDMNIFWNLDEVSIKYFMTTFWLFKKLSMLFVFSSLSVVNFKFCICIF